MTNANTSAGGPDPLFHPAAHYPSPNAVLADRDLSTAEKRIILSSWASDMFAVESHPALRDIPGMDHPIRLADILAAMRKLDDDDDPPPRGGVPMRLRHAAPETESDDEDRPSGQRNAIDRGAQRRFARYRRALAPHDRRRLRAEPDRRTCRDPLGSRCDVMAAR
ncbi:hypothetical protein [Bradyrhizobium cajani]|uniref:hypothetical protein n=1 Tax=Bradyrhizobium cajani TaxID=1928661 RepID=UPI001FE836AA|nr:hypothetical protein [Bradyrhizobium cajani]MCP3370003.1 hypothetical protein [Bradyrhizobium cajani]